MSCGLLRAFVRWRVRVGFVVGVLCVLLGGSGSFSGVSAQQFSDAELDELLAPIALYPDPLLAQILPASTFIDQIDEAARVVGGRTDAQTIDGQSWDVSVKSVAHYPELLSMLAQHRDWTMTLGQAYVAQADAVILSVQRLRAQANAAGTLASNEQQTVTVSPTVIEIEPAQPAVIYVPEYDPDVVYVYDPVAPGAVAAATLVSFGIGVAIGAWLNNGVNWIDHRVYYHGWAGGGWIAAARPRVHIDNVYVDRRFENINVNRDIANRDVTTFRSTLARDGEARRDRQTGAARTQPVDRQRQTDGGVRDHRSEALKGRDVNAQRLEEFKGRQPPSERPAARADHAQPLTRPAPARRPQGAQPAPRPAVRSGPPPSAFSGMNNARATRAYSARGATSRGHARPSGGFRRGR